MEPGIEVPFTNALIQEYERAKIARITDSNQAEVVAEGVINSVRISKTGADVTGESNTSLPTGTVQATAYQILITVELTLKRNSDKSILWAGTFNGERTFNAAQIAAVGVNTANPLYNHSAKRINMEQMAAEMMSEAHDRSTENF